MIEFSIIIPTLERNLLLLDTMHSIRKLDFPTEKLEVIVVDNGPSETTKDLVDQFSSDTELNFIYVAEDRRGLHYARNTGAQKAAGKILLFTDDDIIFEKKSLTAFSVIYDQVDPDAAGGKILVVWDAEPPRWIVPLEHVLGKLDYGSSPRLLRQNETINGGNFSIKAVVLREMGGFDPEQVNEYYIGGGETSLCKRMLGSGKLIAWVPDALVYHRQFVEKNATLADMRRRFANNGVVDGYLAYKAHKARAYRLVILVLLVIPKMVIKFLLALVLRMLRLHWQVYYLYSIHDASLIRYLFKIVSNRQFKYLLAENDPV